MSINSAQGNYNETRERTMACYDALPAALREAHRNAITYFATGPHLSALRKAIKGGRCESEAVADFVANLIEIDAEYVASTGRKLWPDHELLLAAQKPRRRRDWLDTPPKTSARARP